MGVSTESPYRRFLLARPAVRRLKRSLQAALRAVCELENIIPITRPRRPLPEEWEHLLCILHAKLAEVGRIPAMRVMRELYESDPQVARLSVSWHGFRGKLRRNYQKWCGQSFSRSALIDGRSRQKRLQMDRKRFRAQREATLKEEINAINICH